MKTVLLVWTLAVVGAATVQAQPLPKTSHDSQKTLLKNWALSICLAQVAQDERTAKDAGFSASASLEFGKQDLAVYGELRALVAKHVALKYGGSVQSEFKTMKCIDLFHSKELDRLSIKATRAR